ncbi:MAG: Na/Pi cotransporter family protein [Phycisphaeraceae bacterium]|nr:Na/Pi cotransporter family protein [Phycisphaeraceae bacterium]
MIPLLFKLVGGIGLFMLGMVLLTDGLKAFAGDALRRALMRFTGTPTKAFASGALVTAIVQSSSATTVAVIGFVSAGLITFPQAIGVVMGASLGTTGTGWIVAVLGLRVSVGFYALPLVGIGAFMRLLARGRMRSLGLALAGFGLIFIGIETLQDAMRGLSDVFNLAALPAGSFRGYLLAMVIGIVMTVVMQSSSAAVATILTALHTGAINFEQAAALVIGTAMGTTVTGALAAIGGNTPAKRTALAHVLFNLFTGLFAVALLPVLLALIGLAQKHLGLDGGAMSLVAFHTAFIALGVLIFLPFVHRFARLIEYLLPERSPLLTRHLDSTVLHAPPVALEATRRALTETATQTFAYLDQYLAARPATIDEPAKIQFLQALERIQEFFPLIPPANEDEPLTQRRVAQMHAMDHLSRLHGRLRLPTTVHRGLVHPRLRQPVSQFRQLLRTAQEGLRGDLTDDWLEVLQQQAEELDRHRRQNRPLILQETAMGQATPALALDLLDTLIWLQATGNHIWRISLYLTEPVANSSAPVAEASTSSGGDGSTLESET